MKGRNFEKVEKVCHILIYTLLIDFSTFCHKYNIMIFSNSCDSIHNHNFYPTVMENIFFCISMKKLVYFNRKKI